MTAEQAATLTAFLLDNLEKQYHATRTVLAAVPPDRLDFRLGEKGRPACELMWHIVESEVWFARAAVERNFSLPGGGDPMPATTAEMLDLYEKAVPAGIQKIRGMSGEQLAQPVNFGRLRSVTEVLQSWANHSIHHRGVLVGYLRAMNARVPGVLGPSADDREAK